MMNFKEFLVESEETDNVKAMIAKLPTAHSKLLRGYKFKYQPGNTMTGDKENIGQIYQDKITVAAPWNYGREFTTLHEVGHLVYEYLMTKELKKAWSELVKKTKKDQMKMVKKQGKKTDSLDQNDEELFCMAYANCHAGTNVVKYHNPQWMEFIKDKVPS